MSKPHTPLSPDEKSNIADLHRSGLSKQQIIAVTGRSKSAINKTLQTAGLVTAQVRKAKPMTNVERIKQISAEARKRGTSYGKYVAGMG